MSEMQKVFYIKFVREALQELSNLDFQQQVWVQGSPIEMSSMDETVAALFDDSGLGIALEKNAVTFSPYVDKELRELRTLLKKSLAAQQTRSTAEVIASNEWKEICNRAENILSHIRET